MSPYIHTPPVHLYTLLYIHTPPGVYTPLPHVPILLCASVCSWGLLHAMGVVRGPLTWTLLYTSPVWGASPFGLHPHSFASFPCIVMFRDICMSYGDFSLMLGVWGCSPISLGFGGISTWHVHMLSHRTLPWMSLMPLHLQSLLGFSAQMVLFLIILCHSLLLAFKLINCGARLGLFLPLHLWLPRCQHLN